jgi:hypothetical protein
MQTLYDTEVNERTEHDIRLYDSITNINSQHNVAISILYDSLQTLYNTEVNERTEQDARLYDSITNINSRLSQKINNNQLAAVATSGNYSDLSNKPLLLEPIKMTISNTINSLALINFVYSKIISLSTYHPIVCDVYLQMENNSCINVGDLANVLNYFGNDGKMYPLTGSKYIHCRATVFNNKQSNISLYFDNQNTLTNDKGCILIKRYEGILSAEVMPNIELMSSKHNHNDLYYTESEIDTKLSQKANNNQFATVATSGSYKDLTDAPQYISIDIIDPFDAGTISSTAFYQKISDFFATKNINPGDIVLGCNINLYINNNDFSIFQNISIISVESDKISFMGTGYYIQDNSMSAILKVDIGFLGTILVSNNNSSISPPLSLPLRYETLSGFLGKIIFNY